MLKNILGELDNGITSTANTSSNDEAPKPLKVIRKQATESEIEMKKYMESFGKKIADKKKQHDVDGDVS